MNWLEIIEKSLKIWSVKEPEPDEVKKVSELLGTPSKKVQYVLNRWYNEILGKYIDKRCVSICEDVVECIYSPIVGAIPRYFPVILHATGTVLLFEKDYIKTIAFPIHRAMDYGIHGVSIPDETPIEVTERIDGWQITFYYDPILKKWIAATRYVLHNMKFEKGKLVVEDFGNIINPFVETAMVIAEASGLLDKFKGFEGWTFTFILAGPEPAIIKPPHPSKWNWEKYRLYFICARRPDGTLLTVRESSDLLKVEHVPIIEPKSGKELLRIYEKSLNSMSIFLRYGNDKITPTIIEIKSALYPEAMNLKYYNDAKALTILITEGYRDEVLNLIQDDYVKNLAKQFLQTYEDFIKLIETRGEVAEEFLEKVRPYGKDIVNEFIKRNWRRGLRKLLASIASKEKDIQIVLEVFKDLLNTIR